MRLFLIVAFSFLIGCSAAALPDRTQCTPLACPFTDPVHHRSWGGEIATCNTLIRISNDDVPCYVGLGPAIGICTPDPATETYYNPMPPKNYVVASSCEECKHIKNECE